MDLLLDWEWLWLWPIPSAHYWFHLAATCCLEMPWTHHTCYRWTRWMVSRQRFGCMWWHWPKDALVCMMMSRRMIIDDDVLVLACWANGLVNFLMTEADKIDTLISLAPYPSWSSPKKQTVSNMITWQHKVWIKDLHWNDDSIWHGFPRAQTCLQPPYWSPGRWTWFNLGIHSMDLIDRAKDQCSYLEAANRDVLWIWLMFHKNPAAVTRVQTC